MAETNTMRSHFDRLFTIPETEGPIAAPPPAAAAPTPPPAATPAATPWVDPYSMPEFIGGTDTQRAALLAQAGPNPNTPPLQLFLQAQRDAGGAISPEMYDHYYGDEMLKQLQKYDPNARWVNVEMGGGGEGGGGSTPGLKLEYDHTKLPSAGPPGVNASWVPANRELHNPNMVYNDPIYGPLTVAQNIKDTKAAWWEYAAPVAISLLAPYAGAALAAGGIGAAGGTAAVTGAAAGLAAENIAMGAAGGPWWMEALKKAPQIAKQTVPHTDTTPLPAQAPAIPDQFNAGAFNQSGSTAKPDSGQSALVATQFAVDPYGNSHG